MKSKDTIRKLVDLYAFMISQESDFGLRAQVHTLLCCYLDLPKNRFKPFESNDIYILPSFEQAQAYLKRQIFKITKERI